MIILGFQRPLQAPDLWKMDSTREAGLMSTKLEEAWKRRCEKAQAWNERLDNGEVQASLVTRAVWRIKSVGRKTKYQDYVKHWREVDGRKEASLAWAINDVLGRSFWAGGAARSSTCLQGLTLCSPLGVFKVLGDTCQLMGPLVSKALITFSQERAANPDHPPSIGRGIAMAIGLFLLTISASIFTHQVSLAKHLPNIANPDHDLPFSSSGDRCKRAF